MVRHQGRDNATSRRADVGSDPRSPFVADGTFGDLYRADLTNLRHIFAVIFFLDFAFVRAVDLFDTDVQAGQEYSVLMAQDLTVSHSVPLKRSPCFFEGFFADDPNG